MKISKLLVSFFQAKSTAFIPQKEYLLEDNEIIIYIVYLPNFSAIKDELAAFLNSAEVKKTKRFYKETDRNRFIIYRSILKLVLGAYTKLNVKNIYLDYDFNRKPYLASHPWLHFNISHSEDFAAIAVSRRKVGLDIEYMSKDFNFTGMLPDVFNESETNIIEKALDKKNTFYTLWTRKEAFVKALGKGIDEDFKYIPCLDGEYNVDFSLIKNSQDWQVHSFDLADDYVGAIALEGLSTSSKDIFMYKMPNKMHDLLKMAQKRGY
ncbi:4'-phosphopantetheinyl transferase family protein [Flavobacterium olei]|uniref:4'-phosphopantetheinyl transferase family protein n=1 Tax=Flavobacterium olei TaxID=1886782 RepID=UPI00321BABC5